MMKSLLKNYKRVFREHRVVYTIVLLVFALYSVTLIYPLVWVLINSFRIKQNFFFYPLRGLLQEGELVTLINYKNIFTEYNIGEMFFNSAVISVGATVATIIVSAMAAYVVNKYDFPGKKIIYTLSIFIMIIPTTGSIATVYKLMNDTGLSGTYIGLIILAAGGFGFNFFMLYGAFANLSWTYAEASMVDGAGHAGVFFKVMLPLIRPNLFALAIITFIGQWNDYYNPYMYLRERPTLAVGIFQTSFDITTGANSYDYPGLFALMMMATLPIIILFSIFQKKIMSNMVAGGIKG